MKYFVGILLSLFEHCLSQFNWDDVQRLAMQPNVHRGPTLPPNCPEKCSNVTLKWNINLLVVKCHNVITSSNLDSCSHSRLRAKMFSVLSCLVFDFRLQSSNWFLLTFCPDVPWYQRRQLTEHYQQTAGESTRGCSSISPPFSPFWQRPLTAESFWISAIMFFLCNPPHGRRGEKIDLSTFATSSLPFYRHHRLHHSRLQMYRISPQKPLEGAQ